MIRIFTTFFLCFLGWAINAQTTTSPTLPLTNGQVTITFDSSLESRLGKFTGDLYAHTGVTIEGKGDWQNVIGSWGNNNIQPKLTNKGNGIYELTITPDINSFYSVTAGDKVTKISVVFRSSNGSQQTNDLFIDVFQPELNVSIVEPNKELTFKELSDEFKITINATSNDGIKLYHDNTLVTTSGTSSLEHTFTPLSAGMHWIKAVAYSGTSEKTDSVAYFVRENVIIANLPANVREGINYIDDQTATLVLFAPNKENVFVLGDFNNWLPDNDYQMKKDGNRYWLTLNNLTPGKEYTFQYLIDGSIRIADPYSEKVSDPWNDKDIPASVYPDLIAYPDGKTTEIVSVLQAAQTPFAWDVDNFVPAKKEDLVIYETLIRDWSDNGDIKTITDSLNYFKRLGINAIELMPFNEFEGNDSWGYNPSFYFAPDKAYGTKNDYKEFIDACHKRGIAVIMDMVLNHSYGQSPLVRMYFRDGKPTDNNPWYNKDNNFQNPDAQWGYDFNHESEHTKALIDSICSFWMSEYKIDGFRFDFTKGFSNTSYGPSSWGSDYDAARLANLKRMSNEIWKRNPNAIVAFEHLADNSEEKELANHGIMLWGNMNHNYAEGAMGWTEDNKSDLAWGSYKSREWNDPNLIAYMESHDEERIMYKNINWGNVSGSYNTKEVNTALDRLKLASTFYIPIPGPKMIWQFGELGYDVNIDFNGRVGKKPVKWDYYDDPARKGLYDHYAYLNYLKTKYEVFETSDFSLNVNGTVKTIHLNSNDMNITILGNFDVVSQSVIPAFQSTGTWHEFFSQGSINISNVNTAITLQPGEFRLYSDQLIEKPDLKVALSSEKLDLNQYQVNLFPNPVKENLRIESDVNFSAYRIYDLTGRMVLSDDLEFENTIQVEQMIKGIYIIELKTENEKVFVQRFVKK